MKAAIAEFKKADSLSLTLDRMMIYDWHRRHNLSLLSAAYSQIGQFSKAEDALTTLVALPLIFPGDILYRTQLHVFLLIHGRYSELAKGRFAASMSRIPSAELLKMRLLATLGRIRAHHRGKRSVTPGPTSICKRADRLEALPCSWIEVLQAHIDL